MSQQTNAKNINYSSTFSTDKICGVLSNTFTAGSFNLGGYLYQYTIPHSFTRPVFCDALFSTNGTTFVPNGISDTSNSYNVYADANNIYLLTTANSGTIYYKEVSTWVDNYDSTNPLITPTLQTTLPTSTLTYFDSRQNYQKVLLSNVVTLNNPGVGNLGKLVVTHNLGYIPRSRLFFESLPGQIWPSIWGGAQDIWLYDPAHQFECVGAMTNSELGISYQGGTSSAASFRVWYEVYYDG